MTPTQQGLPAWYRGERVDAARRHHAVIAASKTPRKDHAAIGCRRSQPPV